MKKSINIKLTAGFGLCVLLLVAVVGFNFSALQKLDKLYSESLKRTEDMELATDAQHIGEDLYQIIGNAVINRDMAKTERLWAASKKVNLAKLQKVAEIADSPAEFAMIREALTALADIFRIYELEMLPLIRSGASVPGPLADIDAQLDERIDAIELALQRFSKTISDESREANKEFHQVLTNTIRIGLTMSLIGVLASLAVSVLTTRRIVRPLSEITRATLEMKKGNYLVELNYQSDDEIGALADNFREMSEQVEKRTDELQESNERLQREIGVRKQAEEGLLLFKESVENSTDAIGMASPEGTHIYQNKSFTNMFDEFGDNPPNLFVDENFGREMFNAVMRGGQWVGEVKMFAKNKRVVDILLRSYANKDANGCIIGLVGIHTDITERKLAEEEVRRLNDDLEQRVAERTVELRNLYQHLQTCREEERTNISRDIHDDLGQLLTALKIDLLWMRKKLPEEHRLLFEKTLEMETNFDEAVRIVRRISTELRPAILDDFGLTEAIEWHTQEFQKRTGIICEVCSSFDCSTLDVGRSTALFRILQETLTNICRHAEATRVEVTLSKKGDELVASIVDNGKGIDEQQLHDPLSLGLIGMRERARCFGGDVIINRLPDSGTGVRVIIPLDVREKEEPNDQDTDRG